MKKLDLHGVKHEDVDRVVENFVLMNEPPLEIITGNSDKMPTLVRAVFDRHNIHWERWGFAVWKIL
jgi:hypothetical protein|tara:strand:- start:527 stop:724 length:198 start_codon:yes stop_codon:yes gene_type:complete